MTAATPAPPRASAHMETVTATAPEEELLRRYAKSPDPRLEAELVQRFTPLARSLALRYRGTAESNEDLLQVASLALVKALRRYEPERGHRFAAYAAPTILGELRRHFRDHSWRLHMPRRLQEGSQRVERAANQLADRNGRTPSAAEIADHVALDEESVLDILQARESQRPVSLDEPVRRDEPESIPAVEAIGDQDQGYDSVDAQIAIERCAKLDARELQVIELRFDEDLNQEEIGRRIGISQMQVSRLLRRALAKLLEAVQGEEKPNGRRTFEDGRPDARFPRGRLRRRRRHKAQTATSG